MSPTGLPTSPSRSGSGLHAGTHPLEPATSATAKAMMWPTSRKPNAPAWEIDDIRFRAGRTMQLAVQDVETGKYFEVAGEQLRQRSWRRLPDGAIISDSGVIGRPCRATVGRRQACRNSRQDQGRNKGTFANAFRTFETTMGQVPIQRFPNEVRKYGKLAGKYVPGPWRTMSGTSVKIKCFPLAGIRLASEQMERYRKLDIARGARQ